MHVAVAGGTGFLGRHVVPALEARGHRVTVLSRRTGADAKSRLGLRGPDAFVNLVGIKREDGTQTFERVHVDGVRNLINAAKDAGAKRFIHISVVCARPDPASGYHDTKHRAEEVVRASGLDWTILRPGVIYGDGDDMITHLVKMIRTSPVFPVVGSGASLLQPVDARDVAEAVAAALARPESAGHTYDVVGPDRLPLRDVVRLVADACDLPIWVVPTPIFAQRWAVTAMNAAMKNPLSTPAQLQMLVDGLVGDPVPARRDLGLEPRRFTREAVAPLAGPIPPLAGVSARLVDHRLAADWLRSRGPGLGRGLLAAIVGLALITGLLHAGLNVWLAMGAAYVALIPLAWKRDLLSARPRDAAWGLAAAAVLYIGGWAAVALLRAIDPSLAARMTSFLAWRDLLPTAVTLPLLIFIVAGEEIVWRGAVALPLAARLGPWLGSLAGAAVFALVHVALGWPLVVAAFTLGFAWNLVAIKSRGLAVPFVCHLAWDVTVLYALPY
jgi:NADH dehydrogenase